MARHPLSLQRRLCELEERKHELLEKIEQATRSYQLFLLFLLACIAPFSVRLKMRDIMYARREVMHINQQMLDLHEQQVAALFVECLREELAKLPDAWFVSPW